MSTRIRTHTGGSFDFLNIEDNSINVEDIASGLAKECRFAGQTKGNNFISVAQHAVIVSYLVPPEVAYEALHHDSSEAYTGDIPTPMKRLLPDLIKMEKRIQAHIYNKMGIIVTEHSAIKLADSVALSIEAEHFLSEKHDNTTLFKPVNWNVELMAELEKCEKDRFLWSNGMAATDPWPIDVARQVFLGRHNFLKAQYKAKYKPKPKGLLIGLTGKAGAGKDTSAKVIQEQLGNENVLLVSFAQPIREMLKVVFPFLTDKHFYGKLKEEVIPGVGKSPRQLMRALGTDWGRKCVKDSLWLDIALEKAAKVIKDGKNVIITDVRFENEAQKIFEYGGSVVKIVRPSHLCAPSSTDGHISEEGVKTYDIVVENIGDISHLRKEVTEMLDIIKEEQK